MINSKYDKRRCKKCIYGTSEVKGAAHIVCSYASRNKEGHTCLYVGEDKKLHDRRGDDYNNCLLFRRGKKKKSYEW